MKVSEFNALDLDRKSRLVWSWGYYITNKKVGDHNRVVFALEDFFVEFYLSLSLNNVDYAVGLSGDTLLEKYPNLVVSENLFIKSKIKIPDYLREVA